MVVATTEYFLAVTLRAAELAEDAAMRVAAFINLPLAIVFAPFAGWFLPSFKIGVISLPFERVSSGELRSSVSA